MLNLEKAMPMTSRKESRSNANLCVKSCQFCIRTVKWVPVFFIVAIVAWSYYAYVVQLCIGTVTNNVELVFYIICYHFLFFIFLWSYWQTVFTESAYVPNKFRLPLSELEKIEATEDEALQRQIVQRFASSLPIATKTLTGGVRFCDKCQHVKPDRTHHCSVCGKCILKMDHHCPWVNNCVSFTNYKYFILFLAYAFLYCIYVALTSLQYFIRFWKGELKGTGKFNILFLFFVAMMFAFSLVWLFAYHIYLVLNNRTTLEGFRAPVFANGPDKNGFSLGAKQNFQEVFGGDPAKWFFPVFSSRGDGLSYEVRIHQPNYLSMGSTENSSLGDGVDYPQRLVAEDMTGLLHVNDDVEAYDPFYEGNSAGAALLNSAIAL